MWLLLLACGQDSWVDVAAGDDVTCAVAASGRVACWGISLDVAMWDRGVPVEIAEEPDDSLVSVDMLAVGGPTACGLTRTGRAVCWGANFGGVLDVPVEERFVDIAIDDNAACGLRDDGSLSCWGDRTLSVLPSEPLRDVAVSLGDIFGIGRDGALVMTEDWPSPPDWDELVEIEASSWTRLCGRRDDGRVNCWGQAVPAETPLASQLSTHGGGACILDTSGRPSCFGDDRIPELPDEVWQKITAGDGHVCGLRSDGSIVCFGDDEFGQVSEIDEVPDFRLRER